MLFNKFDEYYQKLLNAQYDISEMVNHKLTRWQMREDFLKQIIVSQFPGLSIISGIITDDTAQSPQTDLIITKASCRFRQLGVYNIVDIADVEMVLEVKSNATGTDLKKSNSDFGKIKALATEKIPLCGMFCYRIDLQYKTLISRFGYKWNSRTIAFDPYDNSLVEYPNIDFLICIQEEEDLSGEECEVFIIWNPDGTNWRWEPEPKYSYLRDKPSLKNLFSILSGIHR
jgi:hypothetical protein